MDERDSQASPTGTELPAATVDPATGEPTASTDDVEPDAEVAAEPGEVVGFEDLGLSEDALKTIRDAGYLVPTPIQEQAIPEILDGRDVIGSAQTGTGKTATFTLPIVEQLAGRGGTLAVVLAPTREIAQQTFDAFETFGKPRGVSACVLIGGVDMKPQLEALKSYPQVIIATPGRLFDHMERGTVWLEYVEVIVLDEADRMLDMGFLPQINRIMNEIPADGRQTLLFSATIPPPIEKLCRTMMYDPVRITVGKPMAAATSVDHDIWLCEPGKKMSELRRILREEKGTVIVFSRSKKGVVELWQSLHSAEFYDVTMLHSDRTQEQRMQALSEFKAGKYRILIATDVAARGIDIANVARVVNFDVPFVPEDYVHRIGRSGRASAKGRATTLVTRLDRKLLHDIEKMLGKPIPVTRDATDWARDDRAAADRQRRAQQGGGGRPQSAPSAEGSRAAGPQPGEAGGRAPARGHEEADRQGDGGGSRRRRGRRGGRGRTRGPEGGGQGHAHLDSNQILSSIEEASAAASGEALQGPMTVAIAREGGAPGEPGAPGTGRRRRRRRGGRGRRGRGGQGGGGVQGGAGGAAPSETPQG